MALAVSSVPPAGTLCGLRVLSAGPRPAPGAVAWADRDARDGRCGWAEAAVCVQPGRVWTQVALPLPLPPGPEPGWGQVGLHGDSFCSWLPVPTPLGPQRRGQRSPHTRVCETGCSRVSAGTRRGRAVSCGSLRPASGGTPEDMRSVDKEDFLKVECTPCAFSGVTFTAEQVSSLVRAFVALPREARLAMGKAPVSPGSSGRVGSAPDGTPWLDAPLP